ncbi:MAG: peptide ABC transporter substrate-binding protein [Xanthomonadales bacterium]|nr:peptide ABC transporter substrate-binding protein [Xanthomonadales bacterium]
MPGLCQVLPLLLALAAADRPLERSLGPEPGSLDPHRASDLSSLALLRDLYEGLVTEGPDGTILPGVAGRWEASADGLRWRFELRPEARDCLGRRVGASRFARALARARDPATAAPLAGLLRDLAEVEAIGEDELRIRLHRPVALLPRLLLPIAYPVDVEAAAALGEKAFRPGGAAGNGPYCLAAHRPQDHFRLERNPHFHAAATVRIATVRHHVVEDPEAELRRFRTGALHLTESVPPWPLERLRAEFGPALRVAPLLGVFELGLNLEAPPFAGNPALREALAAAIDRERLVRTVTPGGERPAFGFVPPELWRSAPEPPPWARLARAEREAHARARLAAAGFGPGRPLRLAIRHNSSPLHRRTLLAVAAMWREVLGIEVVLEAEEWRSFLVSRARGRGLEVFRLGWVADVGEPEEFLERFRSGSPLNFTRLRDPEFDALLGAAAAQPAAEREALLRRAEARLLEELPAIPLYFLAGRRLVDPRLAGYADHPLDRHPSRWLHWRE